jgi:hypothetical protein
MKHFVCIFKIFQIQIRKISLIKEKHEWNKQSTVFKFWVFKVEKSIEVKDLQLAKVERIVSTFSVLNYEVNIIEVILSIP